MPLMTSWVMCFNIEASVTRCMVVLNRTINWQLSTGCIVTSFSTRKRYRLT